MKATGWFDGEQTNHIMCSKAGIHLLLHDEEREAKRVVELRAECPQGSPTNRRE
jgi:hypothetical protein